MVDEIRRERYNDQEQNIISDYRTIILQIWHQ